MKRRNVQTSKRPNEPTPGLASQARNARFLRRGVSSVLAMMFLVIFGSLTAAMAVVAQGNLRTADSALKLSRAMSAAETGMVFATRRLAQESARFVVNKGVIDPTFGDRIWMGTYSAADGAVSIIQPAGYNTGPGIIHAIRDAHGQDDHNIIVPGGPTAPTINTSLAELTVPAVGLDTTPYTPYFLLTYTYASNNNNAYVRVKSVGVDGDVRRTLRMDFKITKKIEFAVLSPNRIMIGKNVLIDGPLGSRYGIVAGELDSANGDPLVMRSDFYYLDPALDAKLDLFFSRLHDGAGFDVDGDNRLRPDHPHESLGLNDPELVDVDGDEYVDDFDLFLNHFDANGDHRLVYDSDLTAAAGLGALPVEYGNEDEHDKQLLRLVDQANADRDSDGEITPSDTMLGYNDGIIDDKDQYAKVRGRLAFAVARAPWDAANGDTYQTVVHGGVRAPLDVPPVKFEVTNEEMGEITTQMFDASQAWFAGTGTGSFAGQAGLPGSTIWEPVPFGAVEAAEFGTRGAYDYYNRPVYENITFNNVKIPKGTNALFVNCTFVGVTFIETNPNCTDVNWNLTGAKKKIMVNGLPEYVDHYENMSVLVNGVPVFDTRPESNNIRFHDCDFLGSIAGIRPMEYTHWRNKLQMTGHTRFYIDPQDPDLLAQPDAAALAALLNNIPAASRAEMEKSSMLMPGWSIDVGNFTNEQNPDPTLTPKVKLKGTIIAGILDVRGTADVHGTLLMTYRPVEGEGPLAYGALLDSFNTTIGYFYQSDGDGEGGDPGDENFQGFGEITLRYNPDGKLPDGIPWPLRIEPDPETYVE